MKFTVDRSWRRFAPAFFIVSSCSLWVDVSGLNSGAADASAPIGDASAPLDSSSDSSFEDQSSPLDGGQEPLALVQKVTFEYTQAATNAATFTSDVTAGNFLVAAMVMDADADAATTGSIDDSLHQTWKGTTFHTCTSHIGTKLWYVENSQPGVEIVTLTQSAGTNPLGLALFEYQGVANANALDVEAFLCAPSATTAMATPSVTTTHSDLIFGFFADPCGSGVAMIPGSTWSLVDLNTSYYYLLEDQTGDAGNLSAPPGSYSATATDPPGGTCWIASVAAFKTR